MDCRILKNKSRLTGTAEEEEVKEVLNSNAAGSVKQECVPMCPMMLSDVTNAIPSCYLFCTKFHGWVNIGNQFHSHCYINPVTVL